MAWRLHDTISVGYFNLTELNDNAITKSIVKLHGSTDFGNEFSGFSEKWFDEFKKIYFKIDGNIESDMAYYHVRLVPFKYLKELASIDEHDKSGIDQYFKTLYKQVKDHLTKDNENLHLITLCFED